MRSSRLIVSSVNRTNSISSPPLELYPGLIDLIATAGNCEVSMGQMGGDFILLVSASEEPLYRFSVVPVGESAVSSGKLSAQACLAVMPHTPHIIYRIMRSTLLVVDIFGLNVRDIIFIDPA